MSEPPLRHPLTEDRDWDDKDRPEDRARCPNCNGSGREWEGWPCGECDGDGLLDY